MSKTKNTKNGIQPFSNKDFILKENYDFITAKLSRNRKNLEKEDEIEIAHCINHIDKYGFGFFSQHYLYDKIVTLFEISNKATKGKDKIKLHMPHKQSNA